MTKEPIGLTRVITNHGVVEPDFEKLVDQLGETITFIEIRNRLGELLTLGHVSAPQKETRQHFRLKRDASDLWTPYVRNTRKIIKTLTRFFSGEALGDEFRWASASHLQFDHEIPGALSSAQKPTPKSNGYPADFAPMRPAAQAVQPIRHLRTAYRHRVANFFVVAFLVFGFGSACFFIYDFSVARPRRVEQERVAERRRWQDESERRDRQAREWLSARQSKGEEARNPTTSLRSLPNYGSPPATPPSPPSYSRSFSDLESGAKSPKKPTVIIGSTREGVEDLLEGWKIRRSDRSTAARPLVYYIKDVEVIVSYQGGKAVGVAVIDKPGSGISPIPQRRFDELVALIGGGQPKAADVVRDGSGIREFDVGDAD